MPDRNKSKLILGIFLIALSFIFILLALFFVGQNTKTPKPKSQVEFQVDLGNVISDKAEGDLESSDADQAKGKPLNLQEFLKHAENVYGPDELKRKEGVLWMDRKASSFLVTLGSVNGLREGSLLEVYDDGNKVGEVSVEIPLDIVSYVKPVGKTIADFDKNYYRVSVMNLHP